MAKGYVYFIACKDPNYRISNPHMKIGWTTDLRGRLISIQTGSPVELSIMGYIETEEPKKLERYFHTLFKKDRKHGEWFDVNRSMIAKINSYHVYESRLDDFFLEPEEAISKEVAELKAEIEKLRFIIAERDRSIRELGLPFSRNTKAKGQQLHSSQFHGWPYKAQQEMNYNGGQR